jgi:hypothetical protein
MTGKQLNDLNRKAYQAVQDFRRYLLNIMRQQIGERTVINMTPEVQNVYVNEAEQYLDILGAFMQNSEHVYNAAAESIKWLLNLYTATVYLEQSIGVSFVDYKEEARKFAHNFLVLYLRSYEIHGLLRTGLKEMPVLDQLSDDIQKEITRFAEFIFNLIKLKEQKKFFGSVTLLYLDSTYRQLCYFMSRLSIVSSIKPPSCDPTAPRKE